MTATEPYDLRPVLGLGGVPFSDLAVHPHTLRLRTLSALVDLLHTRFSIDWVGIYRKVCLFIIKHGSHINQYIAQ